MNLYLHYSWIQWLFFFYFYCFFGWCFESVYVSLKNRRLVNRGFMRGPFLPIYGTGTMVMLVVSSPFQNSLILTYIAGCIGATVLEYVTGRAMEALFHMRYWDYSDQRFNFQGHICLSSSLTWGLLTILMTRFLHQPVENFVLAVPEGVLTFITMLLSTILAADFVLSFKAAMDLRDVLVYMEEAKREMERLKKRVDVIIAVADQIKEETRQEAEERIEKWTARIEEKVEDLTEEMEKRFEYIKERLSAGDFSEEWKEELQELKEKFHVQREHRLFLAHRKSFWLRSILKGNPGLNSKVFKEGLEELKAAIEEQRKNDKKKKHR